MKLGDTIAESYNIETYFGRLASGYNPIPDLHLYDLSYIYKYGKLPVKLKKITKAQRQLHNIYTLELTAE